jgi:hypothetical protein
MVVLGVHGFSVSYIFGVISMYNWRKMNQEQREDILKLRKSQESPWHSPRHVQGDKTRFHITAACYEHHNYIGLSPIIQ